MEDNQVPDFVNSFLIDTEQKQEQQPIGDDTPDFVNNFLSDTGQQNQIQQQQQRQQNIPINPVEEADLGFGLRSQYSLEPINSNRIALLQRELGNENVMQDETGEVFVNVDGTFKPVNVDGLSVADFADIAGTAPEMIGAGAGAVMGLGAGSVPAAIAGGAIGSAARQGLSALIGTPQVANIQDRAIETGISAAAGGLSAFGGKQIAKLGKKLIPENQIAGTFKKSAKKANIDLTKMQTLGKEAADAEKAIAEIPIFGRAAKKRINNQVEKIKNNITSEIGEFTEVDFDRLGAGNIAKQRVKQVNQNIKDKAVILFDEVAEKGQKVFAKGSEVKQALSDQLEKSKYFLFDKTGVPLEYNTKGNLTRDQFKKLQTVTGDIMNSLDETARLSDGVVNANDINTLRKLIDSNIREAGKMGADDVALIQLRESFLNVTEDMLGAQSKKLKGSFQQARKLYSRFLKDRELIQKEFRFGGKKEISNEEVVNRIFQNSDSVKKFIDLTDHKTTENAAFEYVKTILSQKLGKDNQISATGALKAIRAKRESLRAAFGVKKYNKIIDNLNTLEEIGGSINPSQTGILDLKTSLVKGTQALIQYNAIRGGTAIGKGLGKVSEKGYKNLLYTPTKATGGSLKDILNGNE